MPLNPADVLTEEMKTKLLEANTKLQECRAFAKMLHDAGLDVSEHMSQIDRLDNLAKGLIRTFVSPRRRTY